MSVNKLKNAWISTDTGASGYSLRNEGTSLFSGTVDVSGQMNINARQHLTQTGYQTVGKRLQFILDATTVSATLSASDSGAIIQATTTNGDRTLYLPSISFLSSCSFHIYVPTTSVGAINLSRGIGGSSNRVRPAVQALTHTSPSLTSPEWYVILPGQSVYVYSDGYSNNWLVTETARNNVENVWTGQNEFRGELTVVDASGNTRSLTDNAGWSYYSDTENGTYMITPAQDAAVFVGADVLNPGSNCVSIGGETVYLSGGGGGVDIGGKLVVNPSVSPSVQFSDLPAYTGSATPSSTQFVTRAYGDAHYTLGGIVTGNNSWSGTNVYSILPTYSGSSTPGSTAFITKAYADATYTNSGGGSYVDTTTDQTVGGIKTFSSPPVMSGASIHSLSIPTTAVAGTAINKGGNQTGITGSKQWTAGTVSFEGTSDLSIISSMNNYGTMTNIERFVNTGKMYNVAYNTLIESQALTPDHIASRTMQISSETNITITLPALSESAGVWTYFVGDAVSTTTIDASGSDLFISDSGETSSITLGPAQMVYIQYVDIYPTSWRYTYFSSSSTYQLKQSNNTWVGTNEFIVQPIYNGSPLITQAIADSTYRTYANLVSGSNTWSNTNTFETNTYVKNAAGTLRNLRDYVTGITVLSDYINMGFGSGGIEVTASTTNIRAANVALCGAGCTATVAGSLSFINNIPTYTGTDTYTSGSQLITRDYADTRYATTAGTVTPMGNNTFSGTNSFSNIVSHAVHPTYLGAAAPSLASEYTPKDYVDGSISSALSVYQTQPHTWTGAQTWNASNTYNALNLSTTTSTSLMQLVRINRNISVSPTAATGYIAFRNDGNQVFNNGTTDSLTIGPDGITATETQTIDFGTNAPTMSGANIASGTIPTAALAGGVVTLTGNQTIAGIKTFSSPPVMSGGSISISSIPTGSVSGTACNLSSNQTISGIKTFSNPPVMSGASITALSIPTTAVAGTAINKGGDQTAITGSKQWTAGTVSFEGTSKLNIVNEMLIDPSGSVTNSGTYTNSGTHVNDSTGSYINVGNQFQRADVSYTTSSTIPTSISGRFIIANPASPAGITLTLPLADSTNNGYWYDIHVLNYDITLATSGTNRFNPTNVASVALKAGQLYRVQQVAAYNWFVGQAMFENYIDSTSNQTIGGTKTFSSSVVFNGALTTTNANNTTAVGAGTSISPPNSVFVGYNAGQNMNGSSGGYNTVIGHSAHKGAAGVATDYDVAIGWEALTSYNSTGGTNTAIGARAGLTLTNGTGNNFFGAFCGQGLAKGNNNLVVGQSMTNLQAGSTASLDNNICVGTYALNLVGDGCSQNVAIGNYGLYTDNYTTGSNNTAVGTQAGLRTNGSNNTFIGACSNSSNFNTDNATYSNCTTIGYNATASASNQIVLGTSTETTLIPGTFKPETIDNSNAIANIASTSWNVLTGSGTLNLTTADSGKTYSQDTGSTGTWLINLPASPPNGTNFTFFNLMSFQMRIATTNTFAWNNNAATEIRLPSGGFQEVSIIYANSKWYPRGNNFDCPKLISNTSNYFRTPSSIGIGQANNMLPFAVSGTTITASVALASPLYGTHLVNAAAATTITLPVINGTYMPGITVRFRKTGNLATVISVAAGTGNTIMIAGNITTVAAGVATVIILAGSTTGQITCISSSGWAIL